MKVSLLVLQSTGVETDDIKAGFYPVTVAYLSLFYTKFEFGRRLAIFYGQSAIAGAFGAILSYFVFSMFPNPWTDPESKDGARNDSSWKSWQVLFLIEGCVTIVIAITGFFWLPHSAKTAWFLTPEERKWAEARIKADQANTSGASSSKRGVEDATGLDEDSEAEGLLGSAPASPITPRRNLPRIDQTNRAVTDDRGLSWHDILSAFLDWKVWYLLVCNILSAIPVTAFSVFLPLVLAPMTNPSMSAATVVDPKSDPALTNLLAAPPFLLGAVVLYAFTSYSDKQRIRLFPILAGLAILLIGLTLTIFLPRPWVIPRYISLCILLSGSFIASPLQVAWLSNNIPQPGKRTVVLGINGWGNFAGVFSAMLFEPRFAPGYEVPFFITFGLVGCAWAGYAVFRVWLVRENSRRDREGGSFRGDRQSLLEDILEDFRLDRAKQWVGEIRAMEREQEGKEFRYGL